MALILSHVFSHDRRKKVPASAGSRNRSLVISSATRKKDKIPAILKGVDSTAAFNQINITTASEDSMNSLKQHANLLTENAETTNEKYGAGMLTYEGNSWMQGSVFVGKNANGRCLMKLNGDSGLALLQSLAANESAAKILRDSTITQVTYSLTTDADSSLNNLEKWRTLTAKCMLNNAASKANIVLDRSSLKLGRKGSSRLISLEPLDVRGKDSEFNKILVNVNLSGQAALRFMGGLFDRSVNLNNLMAFMVHEALKQVGPEDDFLEAVRGSLNKNYRLGSVFIEDVRKKATGKNAATPRELRSCVSSCTTLVNKSVIKSYTGDVFKILNKKLFEVLFERRGEIQDYTTEMEKLVAELNKQIQISKKPPGAQ